MDLKILPELKKLIPPLSEEEFNGLEKSCINEGIRDKLVVWYTPTLDVARLLFPSEMYCYGDNTCKEPVFEDGVYTCPSCNHGIYPEFCVLIDGHNRYEIAQKNDLEYELIEREFESIEDVKDWMIENQLGKRNLTKEQKSYLRGVQYEREKNKVSNKRGKNQYMDEVSGKSYHQPKTEERLSEQHKVSPKTIRNDATYAKAINKIADIAGEEVKEKILNREIKATQKDIVDIAKKEPEEIKEIAKKVTETKDLRKINGEKSLKVHYTSDSEEWYTPKHIIKLTQELFGEIDLDPCSNSKENPNVPALNHFTKIDNGLSKDWKGKVYMNPPYGRVIVDWVEKVKQEYNKGNTTEAILLVPARTDTKWMKILREFPRCFIHGRLNFSNSKDSAPFPSVAIYMGSNIDIFSEKFSQIGDVYKLIN